MVEFMLNYFNVRGRGELIRLIFHMSGQKFEDVRIEPEEWSSHRSQFPLEQLPLLTIKRGDNQVTIGQSLTIARFLARKFGLAGRTGIEVALLEMYADQLNDILNEQLKIAFEKDPHIKRKLEAKLENELLPVSLNSFEERIKTSKSSYLVNSGIGWADLFLFHVIDLLSDKAKKILKNYPHVKSHFKNIGSHPALTNYLRRRPKTSV